MTWQGWLQIAVFAALITAVVKPLGGYIVRNVDGGGRVLRAFAPLERGLYRVAGIDPAEEQGWVDYAMALLWFHLVGIIVLYALLRLQNLLPLNPQQMDAMTPDLALNTAVSFATNTSWQSYGGESRSAICRRCWESWCSRSCRLQSALPWRSHWCAVLRAVRRNRSAISGSI
jgi:K+-transporting ATPase ATPase A chain